MRIRVCYLGTVYGTRKEACCGQQGIGRVVASQRRWTDDRMNSINLWWPCLYIVHSLSPLTSAPFGSQYSLVGSDQAAGRTTEDWWFDARQGQEIILSSPKITDRRWGQSTFILSGWRVSDHSSPFSAGVKNGWINTSTPPEST